MKKKQNKQISVFAIRFIFSLRWAGVLKKTLLPGAATGKHYPPA